MGNSFHISAIFEVMILVRIYRKGVGFYFRERSIGV